PLPSDPEDGRGAGRDGRGPPPRVERAVRDGPRDRGPPPCGPADIHADRCGRRGPHALRPRRPGGRPPRPPPGRPLSVGAGHLRVHDHSVRRGNRGALRCRGPQHDGTDHPDPVGQHPPALDGESIRSPLPESFLPDRDPDSTRSLARGRDLLPHRCVRRPADVPRATRRRRMIARGPILAFVLGLSLLAAAPTASAHLAGAPPITRSGSIGLTAKGTNNSTYHGYIANLGIPPGPGDT